MPIIEVYSTQNCPYCVRAKALLASKNLDYTEFDVGSSAVRLQEMMQRSGLRTVPQIFVDYKSIGGFDELSQMNAAGKLLPEEKVNQHRGNGS